MTTRWLTLGDTAEPSWWRPLEALAEDVARRPDQPGLDVDDFLYCARVVRDALPTLHVYRHLLTHKQLCVDESGRLWRYLGQAAPGLDRYAEIDRVDAFARAEVRRGELLSARTRRGRRTPGWVPGAPGPGATTGAATGGGGPGADDPAVAADPAVGGGPGGEADGTADDLVPAGVGALAGAQTSGAQTAGAQTAGARAW